MRLINALIVALCWLTAACTNENNYSIFKERLDAGATCQELFSLRNSFDPSSADTPKINEDLRSIGCHSNSSVRSSEAPLVEETKSDKYKGVESFTVSQYRMYRASIDSPMNVPESQALKEVAKKYGVSVNEVRGATDKVQQALFQNKWFGTPESEIKHASDWSAENR